MNFVKYKRHQFIIVGIYFTCKLSCIYSISIHELAALRNKPFAINTLLAAVNLVSFIWL
jgi:hypothetical protein